MVVLSGAPRTHVFHSWPARGISGCAINFEFRLVGIHRQTLVIEVEPHGVAAKQGVQQGDLVLDVNQVLVNTTDARQRAVDDAKKAGRQFVLLRMQRGRVVQFVTIPLE